MNRTCFLSSLLVFAAAITSNSVAQDVQKEITLEGRVVGPDREPVKGARICLALNDTLYAITHGYGRVQSTPEVLCVSNAEGIFRTAVPAQYQDVVAIHDFRSALVALGPRGSKLAIDWGAVHLFGTSATAMQEAATDAATAEQQKTSRVLHLRRDDVPIVGKLVTESGRPVVGARVRVADIQEIRNEDLSGYLAIANRDAPQDYDEARRRHVIKHLFGEIGRRDGLGDLLTATTDDSGRFTLHGFGRNRVGWLIIEGGGIMSERVLVRSQMGQTLRIRDGEAVFDFYPAHFEHTVRQSTTVEGMVVEHATGKPLAGVVVESLSHHPLRLFSTTTDESGLYRLSGLPANAKLTLLASAHDTPHLPSIQAVTLPGANALIRFDWKLTRGVWIEGRVFDAESDRAILCHLHYFAFSDNPHVASMIGFRGSLSYPVRPPFSTRANGYYKIPGLPGRGLVTVRVLWPQAGNYPTNKGQEGIAGARESGMWTNYDTQPSECRADMFHGVREVNPSETESRIVQDFPLVPAQALTGRVLDPKGRPLVGYKYAGVGERNFFMHPVQGIEFQVRKYDPTFPRRLIFWHRERRLAGTVVLQGKQRSPIEVTLEPQGALSGRFVDNEGLPLSGLLLEVAPRLAPQSPITISALPEPSYKTDVFGRFRIDGLAPGMKYNLVTRLPNGRQVVFNAVVESGELRDLGDLKPLSTTN